MKRKIIAAGIVLVLGLTVYGFFYVAEAELRAQYEETVVLRAKQTVPAGTLVTAEMTGRLFESVSVPVALLAETAIVSAEELSGHYLSKTISEGELLYRSDFCTVEEQLLLFEEPVALSFRIEDMANAVAGCIRKGDFVTVYRKEAETDQITLVLEKVEIVEAFDASCRKIARSDLDAIATVFTIHLEHKEANAVFEQLHGNSVFLARYAGLTNNES